jgi:hypothetical protein
MPPIDTPTWDPAPVPPVFPPNPPAPPIAKCPTCQLEIVDTQGVAITTTQTKRVGEKIELTARYKSRCSQCSVRWTIPGTVVKGYQDNRTKAVVTDLEAVAKVRIVVAFYWVDGAAGRIVSVRCSCGVGSASATFDVKAPTIDKFDSTTDVVNLNSRGTRIEFGNSDLRGQQPGIKWHWKVTVPAGGDGFLKDVQLINPKTRFVMTDSGKKKVTTIPGLKTPPGVYQLDTNNPYSGPGNYTGVSFPAKVAAGASYADDATYDTPGQPVSGLSSLSLEDKFQYFILYKPDAPDAIWVPVGMAEWSWSVEAKSSGTTWPLLSKDSTQNPSGKGTTKFPVYTSNVEDNRDEEE